MNEPHTLHRQAMDLAEQASLARRNGDDAAARALFLKAFQKERAAAEYFAGRLDEEPTRSVLFRSAASLAIDIGDPESARLLIARALAGRPRTTGSARRNPARQRTILGPPGAASARPPLAGSRLPAGDAVPIYR